MKGFRADVLIAVSALLVSALAMGASWYQSRLLQQQLAAQVWPYVTITNTVERNAVALALSNDGLGPAVMRSIVIAVDGKPQRTSVDLVHALAPGMHGIFDVEVAALGAGAVMRAGDSRTIVRVRDPRLLPRVLANAGRVDVRICYCSLLRECWRSARDDVEPVAVPSCPLSRDQFTAPLPSAPRR